MRAVIITIISLVILGGGFALTQNGAEQPSTEAQNTSQAVPNERLMAIQQDMVEGALLLDVRTAAEYAAGHAQGAINLDNEAIQAGALPEAAKDQKLYVYCRSGNRSDQAAQKLTAAGFTNIVDLGPMTTWSDLGGEIVK